jgi:hypothetical protein
MPGLIAYSLLTSGGSVMQAVSGWTAEVVESVDMAPFKTDYGDR